MIFLSVLSVVLIGAALARPGRMRMLLLGAGLSAALAALAAGVNTDWAVGLDLATLDHFPPNEIHRRDREVFGYIGRPLHVLIAAVVCGSALSAWRRSVLPLAVVTGAVGVGVVVEHILKATIGRTATSEPLMHYAHSFPSGHVTGTAALLGTIAVCTGLQSGRAGKAVLAALVSFCVVGVAVLAVVIAAHTCTDVMGGMLLGGAIVALSAAVFSGVQQRGSVPSAGLQPAGTQA